MVKIFLEHDFLEIGHIYWYQLSAQTIFGGRIPLEKLNLNTDSYFQKIEFSRFLTCAHPNYMWLYECFLSEA